MMKNPIQQQRWQGHRGEQSSRCGRGVGVRGTQQFPCGAVCRQIACDFAEVVLQCRGRDGIFLHQTDIYPSLQLFNHTINHLTHTISVSVGSAPRSSSSCTTRGGRWDGSTSIWIMAPYPIRISWSNNQHCIYNYNTMKISSIQQQIQTR